MDDDLAFCLNQLVDEQDHEQKQSIEKHFQNKQAELKADYQHLRERWATEFQKICNLIGQDFDNCMSFVARELMSSRQAFIVITHMGKLHLEKDIIVVLDHWRQQDLWSQELKLAIDQLKELIDQLTNLIHHYHNNKFASSAVNYQDRSQMQDFADEFNVKLNDVSN
jgi:hypothetical protein